MKIKAVLCDDEEYIYYKLTEMLIDYCNKSDISIELKYYNNAADVLALNYEFQILFLDIDIPNIDIITLADKLHRIGKSPKIIIISGNPDRIPDAFKINAFRLIYKPIAKDKLEDALTDTIYSLYGYCKINVNYHEKIISILQRDILYIESMRDYLNIHLSNGVICTLNDSIRHILNILDDKMFVFCHKGYIVNMIYILNVNNNSFTIKDNCGNFQKAIPISRRKRQSSLECYANFRFLKYQ